MKIKKEDYALLQEAYFELGKEKRFIMQLSRNPLHQHVALNVKGACNDHIKHWLIPAPHPAAIISLY